MVTTTMYHVTDAANVDSILDDGLKADDSMGKVFVMDDADLAVEYGELMPTIDEPTVLEVEVMEHSLTPDDEEPGEKFDGHAFYVHGDIPAYDVCTLDN